MLHKSAELRGADMITRVGRLFGNKHAAILTVGMGAGKGTVAAALNTASMGAGTAGYIASAALTGACYSAVLSGRAGARVGNPL